MFGQSLFERISSLIRDVQEYLKLRLELFQLQLSEKIARIIAVIIALLSLFFVFMLFMVFLGFWLGIYLSEMLDSYIAGFGLVTAFYFILFLLLFVFKRGLIIMPVMNIVIKALFDNREFEKDEKDKEL